MAFLASVAFHFFHFAILCIPLSKFSAGVGRTGTLISIDIALAQAAKEEVVDIPAIVTKMRTERMKMVQSPVRKKY